jgi:hypothetical protein
MIKLYQCFMHYLHKETTFCVYASKDMFVCYLHALEL